MRPKRNYKRRPPHKSTKLIVIVCEGEVTEPNYFRPYTQTDSRIKLELLPPSQDNPNNTPEGLLQRAKKYKAHNDLTKEDQVWIVFDSDQNTSQELIRVRHKIDDAHFRVAQSNPCFEVWIYYHHFTDRPNDAPTTQKGWKQYLDQKISGGVDYALCKEKIWEAITNAESIFEADTDGLPKSYTTECHLLAKEIAEQ